jgi:hypothetical protein
LQDPREVNEDNLSNLRQEVDRRFGNKIREYLKDKINGFESSIRIRTSETCIGA